MPKVRNTNDGAGPVFTGSPLTGSVSVGSNGNAVQGPNVTFEGGVFLSVNTGSSSVSVNSAGSASVGVGGLPLTTLPQYVPCMNLNQLFFVGSDTTALVNYFGW